MTNIFFNSVENWPEHGHKNSKVGNADSLAGKKVLKVSLWKTLGLKKATLGITTHSIMTNMLC